MVSGLILAALARAASAVGFASLGRTVPLWLATASAVTVALLTATVTMALNRQARRAFVVISTFADTTFLTELLEQLTRSLDHHDIEMVVRLPRHDSGRRCQAHRSTYTPAASSYATGQRRSSRVTCEDLTDVARRSDEAEPAETFTALMICTTT
jgi:hypothetical protein